MKGFVRTTVSYEDTPENHAFWKEVRMLALKDGWSVSRLMREALSEYVKRHSPGNPQLGLEHFKHNPDPLPASTIATLEQERMKDRQAKREEARERAFWNSEEGKRWRALHDAKRHTA